MIHNNYEPYPLKKRRTDLDMQGPAQHSLEWTLHLDGVQLLCYINANPVIWVPH